MSKSIRITFEDLTPRLQIVVDKAMFKNLEKASAYIWTVAKNSIKTSKKSSEPGQVPHTRQGVMKRALAFNVNAKEGTAVIGPTQSDLGLIGHTHEFGGDEAPKPVSTRGHHFRLVTGGHGPIRNLTSGDGTWHPLDVLLVVELKSDQQVQRAREVAATIPPSAGGPPSRKARHYPPRPFMGPALLKVKDRIPAIWADSVRGA